MHHKAHKQMSEAFLTAAFLSISGGLQDAYTYLARGNVFANAQTGNIVLLSQHIGAPAQAIVNVGDMVTEGQMIAQPAQGLSVGIHATISGKVTEVTDRHVVIARN